MRGPKIWRAIASLEKFWDPDAPPELTFRMIKRFSTAISIQKNLQIAIQHLQIMADHLAISGGFLRAPLNRLKTHVSRGPPGLSGGPGPLGPHRNSTTACAMDDVCVQNIRRWTAGGQAATSWCATSSGCGRRSITWNRSATRAGRPRQVRRRSSKRPPHLHACAVCCSTDLCSTTGSKPTAPIGITSSASRMAIDRRSNGLTNYSKNNGPLHPAWFS